MLVRVNRVREAYEVELKELECSLKEALDKQQELRKHHMDALQQIDAHKDALRRKEEDLLVVTQVRNDIASPRVACQNILRHMNSHDVA